MDDLHDCQVSKILNLGKIETLDLLWFAVCYIRRQIIQFFIFANSNIM